MKYTAGLFCLAGCAAEPILTRTARQASPADRRYKQLKNMMKHYNDQFDERKYWTYGCQCLILGDRPMSDPGHGPPVDALDAVCKQYKDCLKCARQAHGDDCIGEFVAYKYGEAEGEKYCKSRNNGCERALCECDLAFAKNHVKSADVFNPNYHMFYTTTGFDYETDCPRAPDSGAIHIPKCCGVADGPFKMYNSAKYECCEGQVQKTCQSEPPSKETDELVTIGY